MWSTLFSIIQDVLLAIISFYTTVFFIYICWMTGIYLGAPFGLLIYNNLIAPLLPNREHPAQWYLDIKRDLPKLLGGLVAAALMVRGVRFEREIARGEEERELGDAEAWWVVGIGCIEGLLVLGMFRLILMAYRGTVSRQRHV